MFAEVGLDLANLLVVLWRRGCVAKMEPHSLNRADDMADGLRRGY